MDLREDAECNDDDDDEEEEPCLLWSYLGSIVLFVASWGGYLVVGANNMEVNK